MYILYLSRYYIIFYIIEIIIPMNNLELLKGKKQDFKRIGNLTTRTAMR